MIQTGLLASTHADLVTDSAFDYYGLRLATTSLDQRIKIWRLDENTGQWINEDEWKAHSAPVTRLSWAHPEYGTILASCSFDKLVKVWEEIGPGRIEPDNTAPAPGTGGIGGNGMTGTTGTVGSASRWVERAKFVESKASVRAIEFAPRYFGLKLAVISSDSILRIYECHDLHNLSQWNASITVDVTNLSPPAPVAGLGPNTSLVDSLHSLSAPNPPVSSSAASSNGFSIGSGSTTGDKHGLGKKEADGGWCLSWCKDKTYGELCAVTAGATGCVKIIQLLSSQVAVPVLTLSSTGQTNVEEKPAPAIASVSWAPSCGRRYHLIATGGRDGNVRIWRLTPPEDNQFRLGPGGDSRWKVKNVGTFDDHRSAVTRVEWNVTGTVLSSAGNDGNIRLWKATFGGTWRSMGHIHTNHGDEEPPTDDMEEN